MDINHKSGIPPFRVVTLEWSAAAVFGTQWVWKRLGSRLHAVLSSSFIAGVTTVAPGVTWEPSWTT